MRQISLLKQEIEALKSNPFLSAKAGQELIDGLYSLNNSIRRLSDIFRAAEKELLQEYSGKHPGELLQDIQKQNQVIAQALIALHNQVQSLKDLGNQQPQQEGFKTGQAFKTEQASTEQLSKPDRVQSFTNQPAIQQDLKQPMNSQQPISVQQGTVEKPVNANIDLKQEAKQSVTSQQGIELNQGLQQEQHPLPILFSKQEMEEKQEPPAPEFATPNMLDKAVQELQSKIQTSMQQGLQQPMQSFNQGLQQPSQQSIEMPLISTKDLTITANNVGAEPSNQQSQSLKPETKQPELPELPIPELPPLPGESAKPGIENNEVKKEDTPPALPPLPPMPNTS